MNGHKLAPAFIWTRDNIPISYDWTVTFLGPDNKTAPYYVHLQILASKSLYFAKYFYDEDKRFKETRQREVVIDWSRLGDSKCFEAATSAFDYWVDLVYKLVHHSFTKDSHLRDHPFFMKEPMIASCILDYFAVLPLSIEERAEEVTIEKVGLVEYAQKRCQFCAISPGSLHDWYIWEVLNNDPDKFQDLLDSKEYVTLDLIQVTANHLITYEYKANNTAVRKKYAVQVIGNFLHEHHQDHDLQEIKDVFATACSILKHPCKIRVGDTCFLYDTMARFDYAESFLKFLLVELQLGLAGKSRKKYRCSGGISFRLTELQYNLISCMAAAASNKVMTEISEQHGDLFERFVTGLKKCTTNARAIFRYKQM